MIVLATVGAAPAGARRRRRPRRARPQPPAASVPLARVTVIDAAAVDPADADAWLAAADAGTAEAALRQLARLLRAHRLATADPRATAPGLAHALVARAGYGAGEEVADGRWRRAVELATGDHERRRRRRRDALAPQERLAALLAGRARALACEELTLRARADLDDGHLREGALQLRAALDAALAELPATAAADALAARLEELRARRPEAVALADAALAGTLPPDADDALADLLGRLEAALRARAAAERG